VYVYALTNDFLNDLCAWFEETAGVKQLAVVGGE
jgi:hypothetical protein